MMDACKIAQADCCLDLALLAEAGYCCGMPKRASRRPRDTNLLAAEIVAEATNEEPSEAEPDPDSGKNPAAVALGRLGGKKGGKARATKLSAARRSEIARNAAQARWQRHRRTG